MNYNREGIKTKKEYIQLLNSGMFWEFHPELTGDWEVDKYEIGTRKNLKEVISYILATDDKEIVHFYIDMFVDILNNHILENSKLGCRIQPGLKLHISKGKKETVYTGTLEGGGGFVVTDKENVDLAIQATLIVAKFLKEIRH